MSRSVAEALRGYRIVSAPPVLRHFTARFEGVTVKAVRFWDARVPAPATDPSAATAGRSPPVNATLRRHFTSKLVWHRSWSAGTRFDLCSGLTRPVRASLSALTPRDMDIPRSPAIAKQKKVQRIIFARGRPAGRRAGHGWSRAAEAGGADRGGRHDVARLGQARARCSARSAARARSCPKTSAGSPRPPKRRVERIVTLPSANIIKADTIILELRDERVLQELLDAELQLRGGRGRSRQPQGAPEQRAARAAVAGRQHPGPVSTRAKIQAEANEQLSKEGLQSAVTHADLAGRGRGTRQPPSHRAGAPARFAAGSTRRAARRRAGAGGPAPGALRAAAQPGRGAEGARRARRRAAGGAGRRSASAWRPARTSPAWPFRAA